ncbi:MAG: hypothetical protein K0Q77_1086 [Anaerosporomusa subterranea]|nr:hypothetical protein [Anaerosporomusa subterranea]
MSQLKSALIALFILSFVLKSFIPLAFLSTFMAILAGLVFCLSVQELKPLTRNMIILLLIGSGFFIWSGPGNFDWGRAVIENAGIVTLLLTAPMLGAILYYAPYEAALVALSNRYIQTSYMFYVLTLALVASFCSLMSLAAIPFTNQFISSVAAKYPPGILHQALTRGFAINLFWSPNLISVAVVLQYVNISWQELASAGLAFSALTFIAACVVGKYDTPPDKPYRAEQLTSAEQDQAMAGKSDSRRYISSLVIQVVLVLVALAALTRYAGKSIYVIMAIIAAVMPFLFALALGKVVIYRQRLADYFSNTLPGMSNEFMLFLGIGFFGYALAQSPTIAVVQTQLATINDFRPAVLVLMIIATIAGLSMTGIHPIITISSIAIAFGKMDIGLSNVQLAITLITGYIMYLLLSPFSSMVMIMSGLSGQNVYKMGLKLNVRYALVLSLLVTFAIHVWQQM